MLLQNYISGHQKLYNSDVPADKESLSRQVNIRSRRLLQFIDLQGDVSNFPGENLIATNNNHYYILMVMWLKSLSSGNIQTQGFQDICCIYHSSLFQPSIN
ncbi:hypothetical protein SAMN06296273_0451 [Nitrosomonas ureae]|uniref:Uncharacterized protein n=1 Tax=Nitrosomonas ureae TaxID=44577 RepID=A0A285BUU7_9PROT|nr:hypothetical protein SAMN06296273_0451 [Nitrosomonas ureae]